MLEEAHFRQSRAMACQAARIDLFVPYSTIDLTADRRSTRCTRVMRSLAWSCGRRWGGSPNDRWWSECTCAMLRAGGRPGWPLSAGHQSQPGCSFVERQGCRLSAGTALNHSGEATGTIALSAESGGKGWSSPWVARCPSESGAAWGWPPVSSGVVHARQGQGDRLAARIAFPGSPR